MPRWARFVGPLALLLSLGLLLANWWLRPAPSAPVGQHWPNIALLPLAGSPPLTAATLRRGEVTVVNIFASWCGPCRAEAPHLVALTREGTAIAGVAVRDRPADTRRFLAETGTGFRAVGLDLRGRVQPALGVAGVPETYVVDGTGVIRWRFRGNLQAADLAAVRAAVAAAR